VRVWVVWVVICVCARLCVLATRNGCVCVGGMGGDILVSFFNR